MTCNNLGDCSFTHISIYLWHTPTWFSIFGNMHTALAHSLWYTPKQMQSHLHHDSFFPHCTQSPSSKLTQSFYPAVTSCQIIYIIAWSPLKHSDINWVSTVLCKVWAIVSIHSVILHNSFRNLQCILWQKVQDILVQSVNSEIYTSP